MPPKTPPVWSLFKVLHEHQEHELSSHRWLLEHPKSSQVERISIWPICRICCLRFNDEQKIRSHLFEKHSSDLKKLADYSDQICGEVDSIRSSGNLLRVRLSQDGPLHLHPICAGFRSSEPKIMLHSIIGSKYSKLEIFRLMSIRSEVVHNEQN